MSDLAGRQACPTSSRSSTRRGTSGPRRKRCRCLALVAFKSDGVKAIGSHSSFNSPLPVAIAVECEEQAASRVVLLHAAHLDFVEPPFLVVRSHASCDLQKGPDS